VSDSPAPIQNKPTAPPVEAEQIQEMVDQLQQLMTETLRRQQAHRRRVWVLVLIVILMFGVFGWASYVTVRSNFTAEKVQAALEPRLLEVQPLLQREGRAFTANVLPVYQKLASERLPEALPALQQDMVEQVQLFPAAVYEGIVAMLDASMGRLSGKIESEFVRVFPTLEDPASRERIVEHFEDRVNVEFGQVEQRINDMVNREMTKMFAALEGFPVPAAPEGGETEILRQLAHHLLMLADFELLNAGNPGSVDPPFTVLPERP